MSVLAEVDDLKAQKSVCVSKNKRLLMTSEEADGFCLKSLFDCALSPQRYSCRQFYF